MSNIDNKTLREHSVNEVLKENPRAIDDIDSFLKKVSNKFLETKLYNFPNLCIEARRINYLKQQELRDQGNPGGWSKSKEFKFDYVIPRELYLFMVNMVYRNFWDESNERVWRSFMKQIMKGHDPMLLLRKVKVHYGAVAKHAE